jgi:hypothetical protein
MDSRIGTYLLLPGLVLGACECQELPAPPRLPQQTQVAEVANSEGPAPQLPPPEGTPLSAERLERFVPDRLAGFASAGQVERLDNPLPNGGQLPAVRRSYARAGQKLQLELSDLLHAPGMGELVTSQQGSTRTTKQVDFRGATINGFPAIVQWHSATRIGMVNMLVNGRFLASIQVSPADSAEAAVEAAGALPAREIAQLAPPLVAPAEPTGTNDAPGAASPAQPTSSGGAPAAAPGAQPTSGGAVAPGARAASGATPAAPP